MSFIDEGAPDEVADLRQELAELRASVAEVRGEKLAAAAVDSEKLHQELRDAQTPEQVIQLVDAANREAYGAVHGAAGIEGVDL